MANCELCSNGMECMHNNYVDGLELCNSCFSTYNNKKAEYLEKLLSKKQRKELHTFLAVLVEELTEEEEW